MPPRLVAAARLLIALFCWFTAAYAFVASSAFAYLQFLKPRVLEWVARAGELHRFAAWGWLALVILVVASEWRKDAVRRWGSAALGGWCAAAVIWNSVHPVLPALVPGGVAVLVGCLALAPLLWLAGLDHAGARAMFLSAAGRVDADDARFEQEPELSNRLFRAAGGATVCCAALYALLASIASAQAFEPDLTAAALASGVLWSFVDLATVFSTAFLVLTAVIALARRTARPLLSGYAAIALLLTLVFAVAFVQLVALAIGLEQPSAAIAGAFTAATVVATWSGLRVRRFVRESAEGAPGPVPCLRSALDIFAPPATSPSRRLVAGSVAIVAVALGSFWISQIADWNFLLLNCGIVAVWTAAFVLMASVAQPRPVSLPVIALFCGVPLALQLAAPAATDTHAFDRFSVYNPSARFARALLNPAPPEPRFNGFLRANARLTDVPIEPVSIDFVAPLPPRRQPPPDIFLFVVDSLRPDYLSAYNRAASFTPNIARFADDSLTFRNAFTRFGATGLSVPAIWAGAALPHKQYVQPFAPMNALMKLLQANGYLRLMAMDSVVSELLPRDGDLVDLEHGVQVMDFDLCRTLEEITGQFGSTPAGRPLFAYALPQNLHMSHVRSRPVPPGERYDGFVAPLAAEVHRLDGCFGTFIDDLKRRGRYDNSIIVLTADHGDSLGEDGRWGHSYTLVPEVISIPLIVHLPAGAGREPVADLDAVAMSTDITPTLYAALGYQPRADDGLVGRPLIGEADPAARQRRRDVQVLAASYGAVYAALRQNGTRLYIADAINNSESAYARQPGGAWRSRPVDADERMIGRLAIRHHLDELSRVYNLNLAF
ncbi:MAG TPA: sulfatase-like hydrolase/transferase [Vicinamibacterales bacterium]